MSVAGGITAHTVDWYLPYHPDIIITRGGIVLPGASPKLQRQSRQITSIQPMRSAFEQLSILTYDGIVLELMERMGQTSDTMFERYTDFE